MRHIIFILGLLFFQDVSAQSQQRDLTINAGAVSVPHLENNRVGFDISARYYISDEFSAGGQLFYLKPKFGHGFGYDTDRTLIETGGINLLMQYDVINTEKFTLSLGFANGLLQNVLRDRNKTIYEQTGEGTTRKVPVRIDIENYYILTPYANLSCKIITIDKDGTSLFLTGKLGYQNTFGNGSFTHHKDFTNFIVSFGFTIKGASD